MRMRPPPPSTNRALKTEKKTHFIFGRKNLISSTKSNWNELRLLSHSHNLHFPRGTDESIFLGFHCIRSAVASSRVCFSPFFDYIFLRLLHGNSFANVNQDTVRLFMDLRRTEFSAPPEKMNNVHSASTSFVFAAPRFPFLYRKDYNFLRGQWARETDRAAVATSNRFLKRDKNEHRKNASDTEFLSTRWKSVAHSDMNCVKLELKKTPEKKIIELQSDWR